MLPYLIVGGAAAVVGSAAGFVHPFAPAALIAAIWAVIIGVSRPFIMLALFLVVLYTRPADFIPALSVLQLGKLTAVAALGVTLASKLLERDFSWAKVPTNGPLIFLTVVILISSQLGTDPGHSMEIFKDGWVKILIIYFLIINLVDSPSRAVTVQMTIAACVTFLGAYALYAKLTGQADIEGSRAGAAGLAGDPNDLALVLLTALPFLILGALDLRGKLRALIIAMLALTFLGFLATQSRGGLLGFAAGGYFIMRERVKSRAVVVGVMAVGLVGLLVVAGVTQRQTVATDGGGIDESAQGRLVAWGAGINMFKAHPVFGVGFSEFPYNYWSYAENVTEYWTKEKAAHNSFVKALAEVGITGFIPFCLLLWITLKSAWTLREQARGPPDLVQVMRRAQIPILCGVGTSAFFLSQTWVWFIYILVAHNMAMNRVFLPAPDEVSDTAPSPAASATAR